MFDGTGWFEGKSDFFEGRSTGLIYHHPHPMPPPPPCPRKSSEVQFTLKSTQVRFTLTHTHTHIDPRPIYPQIGRSDCPDVEKVGELL